ncbi:acyl-CoA dehydrogenase [Acetobacter pomorum]|uniref:Acyl-CoA dehydrogenase n=1 Tax=Acetobacter pomorum TaxID=65959 RepID=A0A2G4R7S3_9PROT|nr:acyl-CoA dehydrogenase family protein [Acetobacter pomorum]PHY92621.1 acyl-CoA dehydrogenase [Acetobacter pomorum]GBR49353.1 acyl-CoA dehydrogenase [Acetobacter pomorum DSM 11825]
MKIPSYLLNKFAERAIIHDRSGTLALDTIQDLKNTGITALAIPKNLGGHGANLQEMVETVASLAKVDPSTALILAMQFLHTWAVSVSNEWPSEVREEVLNDILNHGALINALRVEPSLGTPARGGIPDTKLNFKNNEWRLNGRKIFSTGSSALKWGLVWGATDEDTPRIGQFLVSLDQPGIRIEKSWHQLGMRATGSDTIIFENVLVPEKFLVRLLNTQEENPETPGLGRRHAILIATLYDAVAQSAREWFIHFLENRVPSGLGKPLSTLPRFHTILGKIDGLLLTSRVLLNAAIKNELDDKEINQTKRIVTENAISTVGHMLEVTGNPGLSQTNPLEKHYRDVLCGRIHSPQADIILEKSGASVFNEKS